jgi:hypothetical protein
MLDTCKLCGSASALVPRSHVIPQWMYALLPHDGGPMKIASSHLGEFEKKSPTGIYGKFVCRPCENLFSRWDDHAAIVLRRPPTLTSEGWDYGAYSYGDLTRFYLSVLWRASACGQPFFEVVDMGTRNAKLAMALLSTDDTCLDDFDVWPSCSRHLLAYGVLPAIEVTIESSSYWQLYMPRFQALIKIAEQPGAPCLQPHKLKPNSPLRMHEKHFNEFGEVNAAELVFRANMEKKNASRR